MLFYDFLKEGFDFYLALLHKDLKCKAPLIEPNLRRNLGKW
ncbi:benzoate transporter, partial [Acinetobacter baumannii]